MSTFGFVAPAVPLIAKPVAVGIAGAAAALLKPLLIPPLGFGDKPNPGGDELNLGAANSEKIGGSEPITSWDTAVPQTSGVWYAVVTKTYSTSGSKSCGSEVPTADPMPKSII